MGQTITFPQIPEKIYGDKQFNLNAKASSGLTVYYISSDTNIATIIGKTVTIINVGVCTITAKQSGGTNKIYNPAKDVEQNLIIHPKLFTVKGITAYNKIYDGNTAAVINTSGIIYDGLIDSDDILFSVTGTFDNKNVGYNKLVTLKSSYKGFCLKNYIIEDQCTTTSNISEKILTITGITSLNKIYDGNNIATINTTYIIYNGLIKDDNIEASIIGTFDNKNVGDNKIVTLKSTYSGTDLSNYSIKDQLIDTANISAKTVTITGITALHKIYDGNNSATINTSNIVYNDLIDRNDIYITCTCTGIFDDKNVDYNKIVTLKSSYSGTDLLNYNIIDQLTTTSHISEKVLTVTGITALNKIYDGNNNATISTSNIIYNDLINGDDILVYVTGEFDNKNAGYNKIVSLKSSYSGKDLLNYSIINQNITTSNISKAPLTISGIIVNDKIYNGTSVAFISGELKLNGIIIDDIVNLSGSITNANFIQKNVGSNLSVFVDITSLTIDNFNYIITSLKKILKANIIAAPLGISVTLNYNGTTRFTNITPTIIHGLVNSETILTVDLDVNSKNVNNNCNYITFLTVSDGTAIKSNYNLNISYNNSNNNRLNKVIINQSNLTIKANNIIINYGMSFSISNSISNSNFLSKGLLMNDSIKSTIIEYNGSSNIPPTINAGTYKHSIIINNATGDELNNYNIKYINSDLIVNKEDQLIFFPIINKKKVGDSQFKLLATASSGLTVSYISSDTNIVTILEDTVTIVGSGLVTITACQTGNENYNSALNEIQSLTIKNNNLSMDSLSINNLSMNNLSIIKDPTFKKIYSLRKFILKPFGIN